jgi:hypothetical protein
MHFYESQSQITALPAKVWEVLAAAAKWPSWDSGVLEVSGDPVVGKKFSIRAAVDPKRTFALKVTALEPAKQLAVASGNFIFKGVRTYTLEPNNGGTRFTMREEYSGAFVEQIWKSIPDLQPSFDRFASGLKKKVEGA